MGTTIKSVAATNSASKDGVIPLMSKAANNCLLNAEVSINEVGMLINTGLYSQNHVTEPAKAALIQNSLNGKYQTLEEEWREAVNLFSFDLHNGGGGIINAIQVIDGFIQINEIKNGLIVTGDVKPIQATSQSLGFQNGAAALLVTGCSDEKGFIHFKTETFTEYINDIESKTCWDNGEFKFVTDQNEDYLEHCTECAVLTINLFFKEQKLDWDDFDFVLTSQSPPGFAKNLSKNLEIGKKFIQLEDESENFSAGLLFSLANVFQTKEFSSAKNLLFVTVGAGITVSLTHYINE